MTLLERLQGLPSGVAGVATGFLGRYREFDVCLNRELFPVGTKTLLSMGCDVGFHFNNLAQQMLDDPTMQWLWILGDDHDFSPDLWLKLYERNVDIVVPLCLRKNDTAPVINLGKEGGFGPDPNRWECLIGKSGLFDLTGRTVGNAGMLIRRKVFESIPGPWFKQGQLDPRYSSSDIYFSWMVQEHGFKVNLDLDNYIGHIEHVSVWPRRDENGQWFVDYRHAGATPE